MPADLVVAVVVVAVVVVVSIQGCDYRRLQFFLFFFF